LADGLEAEFVEAAEPGEAGRGEGSVEHVEVFRMGSVGTSILAGPRLLSGHRRPNPVYTLNCEEPRNIDWTLCRSALLYSRRSARDC
jgi:hypothetical protein